MYGSDLDADHPVRKIHDMRYISYIQKHKIRNNMRLV